MERLRAQGQLPLRQSLCVRMHRRGSKVGPQYASVYPYWEVLLRVKVLSLATGAVFLWEWSALARKHRMGESNTAPKRAIVPYSVLLHSEVFRGHELCLVSVYCVQVSAVTPRTQFSVCHAVFPRYRKEL